MNHEIGDIVKVVIGGEIWGTARITSLPRAINRRGDSGFFDIEVESATDAGVYSMGPTFRRGATYSRVSGENLIGESPLVKLARSIEVYE